MRAPSTPPGISNALRHQAAARERTYVGNGSVANAEVIATEPSPKKIPMHRTGSITSGVWIWKVSVPNTSAPAMYTSNIALRPNRSISRPATRKPSAPTTPAAARKSPDRDTLRPTSCWA